LRVYEVMQLAKVTEDRCCGFATGCEARLCRAANCLEVLGHSPFSMLDRTARQSRASHPVAKP